MDRRQVLASGLILASGVAARAAAAAPAPGGDPLQAAAREAYIYVFPLMEVASLWSRGLAAGRTLNAYQHKRLPTTPATETVTAPNNDTLSSSAFIDLTGGPAEITIPQTGDRYFSLQFMDAWTNTFAVLGTRTTGGAGGRYLLAGPGQAAPTRAIRAPTNRVWSLARTLSVGADDLPAAHAAQDQLAIKGAAPPAPPGPVATADTPWARYFAGAQAELLRTPPPATDDAVLRRIAPLGLTAAGGFDAARFDATQAAAIAAGVAQAKAQIGGFSTGYRTVGGWSYHAADLGNFGQDYLFRAIIAQTGIAALIPQEAMYLRGAGVGGEGEGEFYPAGGLWRLRFAKGGLPPVDAFWSLTLYRATPEGKLFFFENPLKRYSLGDRSGLAFNRDGSLDLWFGPDDPGGVRSANWLPTPKTGRFAVMLRAYLPRGPLLEHDYQPPAIVRA